MIVAVIIVDLRSGAQATAAHGLAAAYLGFSVSFGHRTIRGIDQHVAHRFAGAPTPKKVPRTGHAQVQYAWRQWWRAAAGWAVACTLLVAAIRLVGDAHRTAELVSWLWGLSAALGIWLVTGPLLGHLRQSWHAR